MRRKPNGSYPGWDHIRFDIHKRDEHCVICNKRGEHVHHIKPRSQGGKNNEDNLVLLCRRCHKGIHDDCPTPEMKAMGIMSAKDATAFLTRYINNKLWECNL